ncbi:tetratricopeptide repeat (TPR)-like superfamily protein [Tasmannia lanceolata]|uniref:tetratricopeptide repeat (TPR)-like superfamily protein n=1 Tax=Tasmannia lanceolata TaxID=3420 RepID=UPI0040635AAC
MMQDLWNAPIGIRPSKSAPCSPIKPLLKTGPESFHVAHKVPIGDSPYVRAKQVQLVDKDPEKAIALFWAAINAGDRVDSALKDMAIVMKQQNRAEEAIEAIKSLRSRCSDQAQESLDNILLDLYKRCGRLDDQIALLKHKLNLIQKGMAFNGKRTKTARSQGRKFQVSVEQEATRLLGNLGWALMQQQNYTEAESAYRKALVIAPDNNKMCNLGICLMKQGRIAEAKETLRQVRPAMADGPRGVDSHLKAFERAQEMLRDLESELMNNSQDRLKQSQLFDAFLGSSSIWQPQPCKDHIPSITNSSKLIDDLDNKQDRFKHSQLFDAFSGASSSLCQAPQPYNKASSIPSTTNPSNFHGDFADENFDVNKINRGVQVDKKALPPPLHKGTKWTVQPQNSLNYNAPPFISKLVKDPRIAQFHDPISTLKRTRSGNITRGLFTEHKTEKSHEPISGIEPSENKTRRRSLSLEKIDNKWLDLLPDSNEFEEAIMAAVLAPFCDTKTMETTSNNPGICHGKIHQKRLKAFQDMTLSLSPRA